MPTKKKRGRPPGGRNERKIGVWLTAEQIDYLEAVVAARGETLSTWIRFTLDKARRENFLLKDEKP